MLLGVKKKGCLGGMKGFGGNWLTLGKQTF